MHSQDYVLVLCTSTHPQSRDKAKFHQQKTFESKQSLSKRVILHEMSKK